MKLNINAKELLALHNLLYEKFESSQGGTCYDADGVKSNADTQLHQVYGRLKACLVAALTNRPVDPIESFLAHEQVKIDKLKDQNEEVKQYAKDVARDPDYFVPEKDEDYMVPEYPRRGARVHRGNNNKNKR